MRLKNRLSDEKRIGLLGNGVAGMRDLLGYIDTVADEYEKMTWELKKLKAKNSEVQRQSSSDKNRAKRGG